MKNNKIDTKSGKIIKNFENKSFDTESSQNIVNILSESVSKYDIEKSALSKNKWISKNPNQFLKNMNTAQSASMIVEEK